MHELDNARYVALTTYKQDGTPVSTPVWITGADGAYAFMTGDKAWKTRRINRNPSVELQVCDLRGRVTPHTAVYQATAEVRSSPEAIASIEHALAAKYGWQFTATRVVDAVKTRFGRGPKQDHVAIHLTLSPL